MIFSHSYGAFLFFSKLYNKEERKLNMKEISDEGRLKQRRGEIDITKPWNYRPWLHTRDCRKGHGTRHIIRDLFYICRLIYLMSDLELHFRIFTNVPSLHRTLVLI